jgi:hypothetical protein
MALRAWRLRAPGPCNREAQAVWLLSTPEPRTYLTHEHSEGRGEIGDVVRRGRFARPLQSSDGGQSKRF